MYSTTMARRRETAKRAVDESIRLDDPLDRGMRRIKVETEILKACKLILKKKKKQHCLRDNSDEVFQVVVVFPQLTVLGCAHFLFQFHGVSFPIARLVTRLK